MRRVTMTAMLGFAALGNLLAAPPARAADRVVTSYGVVEGSGRQPSGVRQFLGMPYARPPLGPLRWAAPEPLSRWPGVRKAAGFGPRCMQQRLFSDMVFRSGGMSEDCLYLNVWTPARSAHERLPVLVYFYGGGFIAGDGSEPRYDGARLAADGIVVVTVNYRLGAFGFMAHPELSRESGGRGSGNYGLLDQHAALQWVHDNVAAFGGDAARVTIAGESAGSVSVCAQMVSPLSKGLIAGAIGESGSILGTLSAQPLAQGEQNGTRFASAAGAGSLADLRAIPADRLLVLAGNPFQAGGKSESFRFAATIDGYFFPRAPAELYAAGAQAHVPLLVGVNTGEGQPGMVLGKSPPTVAAYQAALRSSYGAEADALLEVYPAIADGDGVLDAAQDLAGDLFIAYSTRKWLALASSTGGQPTYYYLFAKPRPPMSPKAQAAAVAEAVAGGGNAQIEPPRGATHSSEIEYALGNLDSNSVYAWTEADQQVSRTMRGYFANFIKRGDPNGAGLPSWPRFSSGQRQRIDVLTRAEAETSAARQALLDRHFAGQ
jgi:para-nitrobenzyl esterase